MADIHKHFKHKSPLLDTVIMSHLYLEKHLRLLLNQKLGKPEIILDNSGTHFRQLVDLCEATGCLKSDICHVLRKINYIRNRYVHNFAYRCPESEVENLLELMEDAKVPHYTAFLNISEYNLNRALLAVCGNFEYRFGHVK